MASQSKQARWIRHVAAHISDQFNLTTEIEAHAHVKVTISNSVGQRFIWYLAHTPSDERAKRQALSTLRRGLAQHFGIGGIQSLSSFPIQNIEWTGTHRDVGDEWWDVLLKS